PVATAPGFNIRAKETLGTTAVPFIVSWPAATDATSRIAGYELAQRVDGGVWSIVAVLPGTVTSARRSLDPGHSYAWRIRARDGVGNWSDPVASRDFKVLSIGERTSAVTYGGTWYTVTTSVAYGGTRRTTTAAGASATFKVYGTSAALIGTLGPTRGSADVYVDGRKVATVSEYESTTRNRAIVTYLQLGPLGNHTIVVRNLATARHPRFDVDGLILIR
ncbi:MAG: fibronectin type III domain-containing protein, partial [Candidatus Limnocylindrales bacterium]